MKSEAEYFAFVEGPVPTCSHPARGQVGTRKVNENKPVPTVPTVPTIKRNVRASAANLSAFEGDTTALRLCLERIAPPRKDAPVSFTLPEMESASDALAAINAIVQAVANGELTPAEASGLAGLVEAFRKTAEFEDLEKRIAKLEASK